MWELVKAGGIMMFPIILCSIVGMGIVVERLITLRKNKVAPAPLMNQVWTWFKDGQIDQFKIEEIKADSPLGRILAAALAAIHKGRDQMKEAIEETAGFVIHDLERYLNALGSIAAVAPLLGLLGTIFGLIEIFNAFLSDGTANAALLAGGIAMALITTASGLMVAIPAVFFHRFLLRRVDELVVAMEQNVTKLIGAIDDSYIASKEKEKQLENFKKTVAAQSEAAAKIKPTTTTVPAPAKEKKLSSKENSIKVAKLAEEKAVIEEIEEMEEIIEENKPAIMTKPEEIEASQREI